MIEKYYFEFSKIYCRLMRLEMVMKQKLISSVLSYYKDDAINTFRRFFCNKDRLERYNRKSGNAILAILNNPQLRNDKKFINVINLFYLSDILVLILNCKEFQQPEITESFYSNIPEKFGILIDSKKILCELRNDIAHYNFKDYEKNKNDYLNVLQKYEYYMGRNIAGIKELPQYGLKPSIKTILKSISELRPDLLEIDVKRDDEMEYYYNKHRVLMDLCDEIALYNGYEPKDLPSPWTILRQMYALKQELGYRHTDKYDLDTQLRLNF